MLKNFNIQHYSEHSPVKLWEFVKADEDCFSYFPDYDHPHVPKRRFMFTVLATIHKEELA